MIRSESSAGPGGVTDGRLRESALKSAIALRDHSFRPQAGEAERRACRRSMRSHALSWRHPGSPSPGPA